MQKKDRRCIGGTGFPIEDIKTIDGNSSIVSRGRQLIDGGSAHQTPLFDVAALADGTSAIGGGAVIGTGSRRPRIRRLIVMMTNAIIARLPTANSHGASTP